MDLKNMREMLDLITKAQEAERNIEASFLQEFGVNVRLWREDKALTQEDFAKLVGGITKTDVYKLESGKMDFPLRRIPRLCAVLDVNVADLFPSLKQEKDSPQ